MPDQLSSTTVTASTAVTPGCDCYVHRFGSIAPGRRVRCYPSDMTDGEWAEVRAAMPVPAWLLRQGGRPEAYCHREMLDQCHEVKPQLTLSSASTEETGLCYPRDRPRSS
ncbi:hypothetical protein GCM10010095_84690 [Streptomyces anthocyanicus]|nr:hypothetical protein GCM10010095_84690 [Streptomyces anthocyanicus]